jgi:regulator of protease activity HflC (stomatin/prohibitin superfamily)
MSGALLGWILIAVVLLALLYMAIAVVPQGMHYTIEQFGRFRRVAQPGLQLVVPFIERVGARISMREHQLDSEQSVPTASGQSMTVHTTVHWQVVDAVKAAYEVHDYRQALADLVAVALRVEAAQHSFDELLADRTGLAGRLQAAIDAECRKWGVEVSRVELSALTLR